MKQRDVLEFIRSMITTAGHAPMLREIVEHFGFRNQNVATCHLRALERKGWITRAESVPRGLALVNPAATPIVMEESPRKQRAQCGPKPQTERPERRGYEPNADVTPEEIAAECAAIRAGWSDRQEALAIADDRYQHEAMQRLGLVSIEFHQWKAPVGFE